MIRESTLLKSIPGIRHAFGTKSENLPKTFEDSWNSSKPHWKQVHGKTSCEIIAVQQDCGEADAVWTIQPKVPIAVVSADCVPILMARSDGKAIAAIHSGWRGTLADISGELARRFGEDLSSWTAAIGPAIGPCCYQVSEELALDFLSRFSDLSKQEVLPSPRMLDLPRLVEHALKRSGIGEVELLRACTRCSRDADGYVYESFRRDRKGSREFSIIEIV